MKEIVFQATFGDEIKTVRLTIPNGTDSKMWEVSIDWYHHGTLYFRDDRWGAYLNDRSVLTTEDIQILGEIIESHA